MQKLFFFAQNDTTDADGFFLEGDAFLAAEREALRATGAPDADTIVLVAYEATDREEAIVEALVTDAFAEWARREEIVVDRE